MCCCSIHLSFLHLADTASHAACHCDGKCERVCPIHAAILREHECTRAAVRTCSHVAFEVPSCKHLIMVAEGLRSTEVQLSCVAACLSCIHISCIGHRACASNELSLTPPASSIDRRLPTAHRLHSVAEGLIALPERSALSALLDHAAVCQDYE